MDLFQSQQITGLQTDEFDSAHKKFKEIISKKSEMEGLMQNILDKVKDNKSLGSLEGMKILDMLCEIKPFISEVDQSIEDVEDAKFMSFYSTFRKLFKSFRLNLQGALQEVEDTFKTGQKISKEKIAAIKQSILNMKSELQKLQKGVFTQSKRYLLWMDYEVKNSENEHYLTLFQDLCNGAIKIRTFNQDQAFRNYITEKPDRLYYIVMSGKAAGEYPGDGCNLKWVKSFMNNSNATSIYGVIIFTSYTGYPYFTPLLQTHKGFVHAVAQEIDPVLDSLKKIIFPKDNVRVIHLDQLEFFLSHKKQPFLDISNKDLSNLNILDYHPDKSYQIEGDKSKIKQELLQQYEGKNLQERLQFVKKLVEQYKLKISGNYMVIDEIYQTLKQCFVQNASQEQISRNILRLYTAEGPYYHFINSILGIMNEEILTAIWDLFICLKIALNSYDDSKESNIKNDGVPVNLFRGVSIPPQQFEQTYSKGKIILMCGFLSFSSSKLTAELFAAGISSNKSVVFRIQYKCGKAQYQSRPKLLRPISEHAEEDEYLFPCGTVFIIQNIVEENNYTYIDISV